MQGGVQKNGSSLLGSFIGTLTSKRPQDKLVIERNGTSSLPAKRVMMVMGKPHFVCSPSSMFRGVVQPSRNGTYEQSDPRS